MARHHRWIWVPLAAAFLVPAGPAVAAQRAPASTDAQLQTEIERKIAGLKLKSSHITVAVHDHTVTLDGSVPTLRSKHDVIDQTRKTPGVQEVDSTIAVARAESDTQLAAAVSRELQQYSRMTVYDFVQGSMRDGVVTLIGAVTDPIKSTEITAEIEKIKGIQDIANRIVALPVSPSDDRIRVKIADDIYSDPLFVNYSLASPPIHVIVENGHVTLIGIVASTIERSKAETYARLVSGVFSVDDKILLASELRR